MNYTQHLFTWHAKYIYTLCSTKKEHVGQHTLMWQGAHASFRHHHHQRSPPWILLPECIIDTFYHLCPYVFDLSVGRICHRMYPFDLSVFFFFYWKSLKHKIVYWFETVHKVCVILSRLSAARVCRREWHIQIVHYVFMDFKSWLERASFPFATCSLILHHCSLSCKDGWIDGFSNNYRRDFTLLSPICMAFPHALKARKTVPLNPQILSKTFAVTDS